MVERGALALPVHCAHLSAQARGDIIMYAVRMTPLDRPGGAMDIPEFSTPRDAWNNLLTELERDQDARDEEYKSSDIADVGQVETWHAYQTAIDDVLEMNLNLPGEIKVGSEYKYEVLAS